jgi:hypothetical protein
MAVQTSVAIDGRKFKAANNRDRNFTRAKMEWRMAQIGESVARYLQQLDSAADVTRCQCYRHDIFCTTKTLSRHQQAVAQGRDLVEPGSGKMNVSLNCSCHGSWPAVGRIAL